MPVTDSQSSGIDNAALQKDEDTTVPRLRLGEVGFGGLKVSNKHIYEETMKAFRYPAFIKTVNEMRNNPTVGAAMNVYRFMMNKVEWTVEVSKDATDIDKQRAKLITSMMHDMEHSWASFVESIIPYLEYGFAVNEIVLRRRLKRNGSKWNDGLIGIKKLPTRSQDTISGWVFSEDGNELVAVEQSLQHIENAYRFRNRTNDSGNIVIDREKFLLFNTNSAKGNPEGNSIYKNIYLAFKQLTLLQEDQLRGVAKDIQGMLKIEIPPKYLDPNASDEDKAAVAGFQAIIDNYNAGTARGILVPSMIDPDSKLPLFNYSLLESKGVSKYDTESIIKGLQSDILSALSVDVIKLGAEGSGSFSLAESKTSVLALAVGSKLKEIEETLNQHLMRTLYEANGWGCENLPKFKAEPIEEVNLAEFSAAVQRIFAVGAVEVDRPILNKVRLMLGVPAIPDDTPVDKEKLPANMSATQTRSGDGMSVGTSGNGTAKNANSSSGDSSVANKENTA